MKVLITNIYSWENKGDAAIVLAMIDDIKTQLRPSKITLSSHDVRDKGRYGDYTIHASVLRILKRSLGQRETLPFLLLFALRFNLFRIAFLVFRALKRLHVCAYCLFPSKISEKLRAYQESDVVIACGGGYLQTTSRRRKVERMTGVSDIKCLALDFSLANAFGKPYILYNQSVGPFHNPGDVSLILSELKGAKAILCREELTYQRLKNIGLNNIVLTADIAFRLDAEPTSVLDRYGFDPKNKANVGLTARRCLPERSQKEYELKLAIFMANICASDDSIVVFFIPQVINRAFCDNDIEVASRIRDLLAEAFKHRFHIITEDLTPGAVKYIISNMDFFVGTRMHSNIFALSSGVPTLAISYDKKTDGIMKMLGLSDFVIQVDNFSLHNLETVFAALRNGSDFSQRLTSGLNNLRELIPVDLTTLLGQR
jgi:colanic acid/amylovoran biosynthesis protein